jgi:hypothetical protein
MRLFPLLKMLAVMICSMTLNVLASTESKAAYVPCAGFNWIVSSGSLSLGPTSTPVGDATTEFGNAFPNTTWNEAEAHFFNFSCNFLSIGSAKLTIDAKDNVNSVQAPVVPSNFNSWNLVNHSMTTKRFIDLSLVTNPADLANIQAVLYDQEDWAGTPAVEKQDPATYVCNEYQQTQKYQKLLIATPAIDLVTYNKLPGADRYQAFLNSGWIEKIAACADVFDIQAQALELTPTTYTTYASFVHDVATKARQAASDAYYTPTKFPLLKVKRSSPQIVMMAGLTTNSALNVKGADLKAAADSVQNYVEGFWINLPVQGTDCPNCGVIQNTAAAVYMLQALNGGR